MPGRTLTGVEGRYRYGFNGKEKDSDGEWGSANHYDYGFRIYNPRVARFLSVDPLMASYPFYTPYQFAANTPILAIDVDGLESDVVINIAESLVGTPYEWGGKNPASKFVGIIMLDPREYQAVKPKLDLIKQSSPSYQTRIAFPRVKRAIQREVGINPDLEAYSWNYWAKLRASIYDELGVPKSHSCGIDCSGLVAYAYSQDKELLGDFSFFGSANTFNEFVESLDNLDIQAGIVFADPNSISEADLLYKKNHIMMATGVVVRDADGNVTQIEIMESNGSQGVVTRFAEKSEFEKYRFLHPFRTSDPGYMQNPTNRFEIWERTIDLKQYDTNDDSDSQ